MLSYISRLRELLLGKIAQLGWGPKVLAMHSLKAGGATIAANAGVPDSFKAGGATIAANAGVPDSLKAGGATIAANAGVPDRLLKRHDRWKPETAKDGYVKDSVESRLAVSKVWVYERWVCGS